MMAAVCRLCGVFVLPAVVPLGLWGLVLVGDLVLLFVGLAVLLVVVVGKGGRLGGTSVGCKIGCANCLWRCGYLSIAFCGGAL